MEGSLSRFRVSLVAGVVCLLLVPGFSPNIDIAGADEAPTRTIELSTGWNLVSLPVNHSGWTAADWSNSLEENTSLYVLSLCDWESGWVSYLRRDGTTLELISWHGSTDYLLDRNESYLIYAVENTGKPLDHSYEITLFTDYIGPLPEIELEKGWNNIAIPYTFGGRLDTQDILYTNNDIDITATWDYNTESWLTTPGDGTYDIQKTQNGPADYTMTHNANGLFIRSKTGFTWTGEKRWSEDILLTDGTDNIKCRDHAISVNGDAIHVVYRDNWGPFFQYSELRYIRSFDGGRTWDQEMNLTENDSYSTNMPEIFVCSENVYVVYADGRSSKTEIWFNSSYDSGDSWNGETNITDADQNNSYDHRIAAVEDYVFVVWSDVKIHGSGDYEVFFRRSMDKGQNWESEKRLTNRADIGTHSNRIDAISVNGSNIHVLFTGYNSTFNKWCVFYIKSEDYGQSWEAPLLLSFEDKTYHCSGHDIFVNGSNVYAVWMNSTPNSDVMFRMSDGNGDAGTWYPEVQVTSDSNQSGTPRLGLIDNNIHIFYRDDQNGGDVAIYHTNSTDGISWDLPMFISEPANDDMRLETKENIIHLLWTDNRTGDWEIYYKRSPW